MIEVRINGVTPHTPEKHPLAVPTQTLADAIASEWAMGVKYSPSKMPLTSLAYTAIDRIAPQKELIVETLLVYIDTDSLCYRATAQKLAKQQEELWDPVLGWAGRAFGVIFSVASGVMPQDQSPDLHKAVEKYLLSLTPMELSAACVLSSGYSSLALALAVLKKHLTAAEAFDLSRLEEESQIEQWGRDEEADQRAQRLKAEMLDAGRFLSLLEAA